MSADDSPSDATLPPAAIVAMDDVSVDYGGPAPALAEITMALAPGSFTLVTGGSGAGKTSLLRAIGLALQPSGGQLSVLGHDTAALPRGARAALRRQIGMVFQDFRLLPHLSVLENAMLPLRVAGVANATRREQATELLRWVGLGDRLDALPPTLSGGQQQRVAIARAVISRPRILLADEPTGSVDEEIGMRLVGLFQAMHREGATVVIATHSSVLIDALGYPEIRLAEGRIVPDSLVESAKRRPLTGQGEA